MWLFYFHKAKAQKLPEKLFFENYICRGSSGNEEPPTNVDPLNISSVDCCTLCGIFAFHSTCAPRHVREAVDLLQKKLYFVSLQHYVFQFLECKSALAILLWSFKFKWLYTYKYWQALCFRKSFRTMNMEVIQGRNLKPILSYCGNDAFSSAYAPICFSV